MHKKPDHDQPERAPKNTDRDWPLPHPPAEDLKSGAEHAEDETPAGRVQAMVETARVTAPEPLSEPEALLVALEARCAAGGSAGLEDVRAVLRALRGE
jgi:hypothetical protein